MSHLELVDLDEKFERLPHQPFIANTLNLDSEEDKERFNNLIYTHYDGESLKLTPSCVCGKLKAEYLMGEVCPVCNTVCSPNYSGEPESFVWIQCPDKVGEFILPAVWLMLSNAYRDKGVDVIRYFCDPYYRANKRLPDIIEKYKEKGHQRGYKYFVDNFYQIIDDITIRPNGRILKKHQDIYKLIQDNKDKIFCKMLPVPNKTILVLEQNKNARYFDKNLFPAIDAVILATELGKFGDNVKLSKYENKVVNIIDRLAAFFNNFCSKLLTGKKGNFRKHVFAARMHFSARQVITSNHGVHKADRLTIPWTAAVKLFTEHLRSKLLKHPYCMDIYQINDLLTFATNNYDETIDKLLHEIIVKDTKSGGFPCLFSRAPILTRGSIQFFYIDEYMKDPDINVIKISPLVLVMPNAD